MTRHEIIVALDQEIQRLETARTLIRNSRDVAAGMTVRNAMQNPPSGGRSARKGASKSSRHSVAAGPSRRKRKTPRGPSRLHEALRLETVERSLTDAVLRVKLLEPEAKAPTVADPGSDLGFDLYALEEWCWSPA